MLTGTSKTGKAGERFAEAYIKKLGFHLLDSNWRRPWGELDLVAEKEGIVHFIEVKASSAPAEGFEPQLRADPKKMKKVERTARTWLVANRYPWDQPWQMDVIAIIGPEGDGSVEFFENV